MLQRGPLASHTFFIASLSQEHRSAQAVIEVHMSAKALADGLPHIAQKLWAVVDGPNQHGFFAAAIEEVVGAEPRRCVLVLNLGSKARRNVRHLVRDVFGDGVVPVAQSRGDVSLHAYRLRDDPALAALPGLEAQIGARVVASLLPSVFLPTECGKRDELRVRLGGRGGGPLVFDAAGQSRKMFAKLFAFAPGSSLVFAKWLTLSPSPPLEPGALVASNTLRRIQVAVEDPSTSYFVLVSRGERSSFPATAEHFLKIAERPGASSLLHESIVSTVLVSCDETTVTVKGYTIVPSDCPLVVDEVRTRLLNFWTAFSSELGTLRPSFYREQPKSLPPGRVGE